MIVGLVSATFSGKLFRDKCFGEEHTKLRSGTRPQIFQNQASKVLWMKSVEECVTRRQLTSIEKALLVGFISLQT